MSEAAGRTVVTGDGRRVTLGKLIKSGGAGSVHRVAGDAASVAKLYHDTVDLPMYARKVAAMLELRPQLPDLADGDQPIVQLAWPQAAIFDAQRRFLGYLMPTVDIDATSELECVLQERQARQMQLPTGLGAKVTLAANLSTVIAELHRQRHYIVDLKPVNLRFYRRSLYLALLDCDGFSIQGRGERFEAPHFTPDYLAPEFHAPGLTVAGEAQQDRFALAVIVFQLLNFGIHPFTGRPQHGQVPTDVPSRIAGRYYSHGLRGNTSMLPIPSSGHTAMPAELRTLFDRAFDSHAGTTRPSADEWSDVLRGYAQRAAGKLRVCAREASHQHFTGHACAACARMERLAEAKAAAAAAPPRLSPPPPPPPRTTPRATRLAQARAPAQVPPAWTKPSPAPNSPFRRTSSSPLPPPRPLSQVPPYTAHATLQNAPPINWNRLLFGAIGFALLIIIVFVALDHADSTPERRDVAPMPASPPRPIVLREAPAVEGEAEPVADANGNYPGTYVANPAARSWPLDLELRQLHKSIDSIALNVGERDTYVLGKQLPALRAAAEQRRKEGYTQAGQGSVPLPNGVEGALYTLAQNLHQRPVDASGADHLGWTLLERGNLEWAEYYFLQAIWADPDQPAAWFGYALVQERRELTVGAMTVAVLMYADDDLAQQRYDLALRDVWPKLPVTREEFVSNFAKATILADALRPNLPRGSIRPRSAGAPVVDPTGSGPRPGHPFPDDFELQALESQIEEVANAMYQGRVLAVNSGIIGLHEVRKARKDAWDKPLALPVPAVSADRIPGDAIAVDLHRLAERPFDSALAQSLGWAFLREHQNREARRLMLQAIWADPANVDAWYGYGLLRRDTTEGKGAMAIGLLLDPPYQARARRDGARAVLLPASCVGEKDLDDQLKKAEDIAAMVRSRVSRSALKGPAR